MAITVFRSGNRLAPWGAFDPIARPFGRLVGDSRLFDSIARRAPAVNVEETADELILTADLPGYTREAIETTLENGVLTIRGEKGERTGERYYHLHERRTGRFERSFNVPRTVSAEAVTATFENGVLRVRMPKAPESKGRRIEIRRPS